jgi:hypothetical protein
MSTTLLQGQAAQPIQVGSIQPPTQRAKAIFDAMCDPKNWKLPTQSFVSSDPQVLREVAYALTFYCGGHEVTILDLKTNEHKLRSCGYYHYVGA